MIGYCCPPIKSASLTVFKLRPRCYGPVGSTLILLFFSIVSSADASASNEDAPLGYFLHSYGPASAPILYLGWVLAAVAIAVFVIIVLLLAGALFRNRPVADSDAIGQEDQGMSWIYIGTGLSSCILFALAVYVLITLNKIAKPVSAPTLELTVTGYDWWWKVEYDEGNPSLRFETANEIHIPVGRPVLVKLKSADVIHAFWVPKLAGKTQMIPGLTNQQWLQADAEGSYRGQCTQYCGVQHAHMGFEIVAQNPSDFLKWKENQLKPATEADSAEVDAGKILFLDRCSGCHTIRGTEAKGAHGPDLTHLNSRRLIAAGLMANTPENRMRWVTQAQDIKPGARMPGFGLSPDEFAALSSFLSTLN